MDVALLVICTETVERNVIVIDNYFSVVIDLAARKGGNAFVGLGGVNLTVLVGIHEDMGVLSANSGICRIGMDYRSMSQVLDGFIQ